jgi:8-oxo-dGTP pyrophosphatase MutT (NUDIX family)
VSPYRPDLVDCWIFRVRDGEQPEILLIRRSPGRILPGLWQCVSGSIEPGERVAMAALREVAEETGYGPATIEAFYDLDLVNQFHEPSVDAVLASAVFAVRVRADAEPTLSHEHEAFRWLTLVEGAVAAVWPGYREAIDRIRENLFDPDRARWFELTMDGRRAIE